LEENQNSNEPLQSQALPATQHSENITPETSIITPEIKQATLTIPLSAEALAKAESQTDTMEVHKHPHHVMRKKKWTEYLLEFLMLFLAVFLGFIAENIREHAIEHKRAKEYAKGLLSDLKNDVAELDRSARFDSLVSVMMDSLVHFIDKGVNQSNSGQFYYLSKLANGLYITDWNKVTLNQLINSGSLRYFRNMELVGKINFYNTLSNTIISLQQTISTRRERPNQYADRIFTPEFQLRYMQFHTDDILDGKKKSLIDSLRNTEAPLQTNDPSLFNSFGNAILGTKPNRNNLLTELYPTARKSAIEIIELIKKEYRLEDD